MKIFSHQKTPEINEYHIPGKTSHIVFYRLLKYVIFTVTIKTYILLIQKYFIALIVQHPTSPVTFPAPFFHFPASFSHAKIFTGRSMLTVLLRFSLY